MPTTPLVYCEADATAWQSPAYGAGTGNHLPIGTWQGTHYRSIIRFPLPAGWTGWTAITKATLSFGISDFAHVGVRNSSINVYRQAISSSQWTKGEGSSTCESLTSGNTTQYSDMAPTAGDAASFSSGSTANASKSVDVTAALRYYWGNNAKPVFIFDGASASDYTELWSRDKTGGWDITLSIDYETASPPNAPTLTGPTAGQVVVPTKPTFAWTHSDPQGDPQSQANVQLYDAGGTAIGSPVNVAGSAGSLTWPTDLTRGTTYQFAVQTADAISGFGAYSAKRSFSIKALPVVSIDANRYMVFANGAPRLQVRWTCNVAQASYQVSAPGYAPAAVVSPNQTQTLDTLAITNGTAVNITVNVTDADGLTGTASRSFTPRFGLTVHRRDLGSVPAGWGVPVIDSGVMPADASLVIEYGSNTSAVSAPTAWYSSIGPVPLAQWLFYRAWLIPSATTGPTLNSISVPVISGVQSVDKWETAHGGGVLSAPWSVSVSEFVYGSRSMQVAVGGAGPYYCYSFPVSVKPGRNYTLSGLMKSTGNSGACIQLQDAAGNVLKGGGVSYPPNSDMSTEVLTDPLGRDWYVGGTVRDTWRYKTPVYTADSDKTVYVVLKAGGTAGTKAYFDAIKLEESTVATPWSPGAVGATIIDAGGVQVDGSKGGVFRYRGTTGGTRDVVEGGPRGLAFGGGDTNLYSGVADTLRTDDSMDVGLHLFVGGIIVGFSFLRMGGTSFPGSPSANDRYYRTDLGMEFFWDGTRWLSTVVYELTLPAVVGLTISNGDPQSRTAVPSKRGGSDIWLVAANLASYQVAAGGTALSATHKWDVNVNGYGAGGVITGWSTFNINSGASGVIRVGTPGPVNAINQLLGTYNAWFFLFLSKTGTPGNLDANVSITYRIVAT